MTAFVPNIVLNNGHTIPAFGLGTWKAAPGVVKETVKTAISIGYRHFDCAAGYGNEAEIGEAITEKIQDGTVKREELFLTSKVWLTYMRADLLPKCLKQSLVDLRVDYLDLYLLHWPLALKEGDNRFPKDAEGKCLPGATNYLESYKALEECARKGLAKSIGVCNFNIEQLGKLLAVATIKPVLNQIECHPYLTNKDVIAFAKKNNVLTTAYSPLGSPDRPVQKPTDPVLLEEPLLDTLASKYNKNKGQILLRYQIQTGNSVVAKSTSKTRLETNLQIFDFEISADDMKKIDALNTNNRYLTFPMIMNHPDYPFVL